MPYTYVLIGLLSLEAFCISTRVQAYYRLMPAATAEVPHTADKLLAACQDLPRPHGVHLKFSIVYSDFIRSAYFAQYLNAALE